MQCVDSFLWYVFVYILLAFHVATTQGSLARIMLCIMVTVRETPLGRAILVTEVWMETREQIL